MKQLLTMILIYMVTLVITAQEENPINFIPTYHQPDGNRVIFGHGTFPNVQQVDIPLSGAPEWLLGTQVGQDAVWIATLENGQVQGIYPVQGVYQSSEPFVNQLPPGMPPVLRRINHGASIVFDLPAGIAPYTHPVYQTDRETFILEDGGVMLFGADWREITRLSVNAQPDGRIVLTPAGHAALYVGATNQRYVHGIMGDDLEGVSLLVFDLQDGSIISTVDLDGDSVFEGLSPFWADVNEDGKLDLITTVSNAAQGAQIRVYQDDGSILAQGPAIGRGGRWRHQLAWGAFGINGENLLVEVLTPHIGGVVGFYRYDGAGNLEIIAQRSGYTSHVIGSRNLDMAVAGDFDGDGQLEIVLPSQDRTRIAGLGLNTNGDIEEKWSFPLDGLLVTNLSAITMDDGTLALAVGIMTESGGILRLWY
ncbi:MAG: hypothetical protein Kow00117_00560 [Phototrophicales bacterium]